MNATGTGVSVTFCRARFAFCDTMQLPPVFSDSNERKMPESPGWAESFRSDAVQPNKRGGRVFLPVLGGCARTGRASKGNKSNRAS